MYIETTLVQATKPVCQSEVALALFQAILLSVPFWIGAAEFLSVNKKFNWYLYTALYFSYQILIISFAFIISALWLGTTFSDELRFGLAGINAFLIAVGAVIGLILTRPIRSDGLRNISVIIVFTTSVFMTVITMPMMLAGRWPALWQISLFAVGGALFILGSAIFMTRR